MPAGSNLGGVTTELRHTFVLFVFNLSYATALTNGFILGFFVVSDDHYTHSLGEKQNKIADNKILLYSTANTKSLCRETHYHVLRNKKQNKSAQNKMVRC